jgi:large repetitive protein
MKLFFTIVGLLFSFQLSATENISEAVHPPAITLTVTTINTTCQKANGRIVVQAAGGVAPYDYKISGPFAPQPSGIFYSIPAGTYTITVTDAIGVVATQSVTLTNTFLSPIPFVISRTSPTGCSTFDATITLGGNGGVPPYTYSLNNVTYQTSNSFTNLTAGGYMYAVKDANGCSSFPSNLIYGTGMSASCTMEVSGGGRNITCLPVYSISTDLFPVIGGIPPYTFSNDGINYQTSSYFNNITAFSTFWVKDATGLIVLYSSSTMDDCYQPFSVIAVTQPAQCGLNGSIIVTASNGLAPYLYSIDGVTFQTSNQFTGLAPGIYTITVKDGDNLTNARSINVPNNCTIIATNTTSSTCGNSNGKITAQSSNGTAPYQYSLDGITYAANNIFTNLLAGNYTVYTKDAVGNLATANVVISNIAGPQIIAADTTATSCANNTGTINVVAQGGTAPLTYSINGTSFQTNPLFTGLAQGAYTVSVKDANTCAVTKSAIIAMNNNAPVVNLGNDITLCEDNTLLLDATNSNATYLWQDNTTNPTYFVTTAGKYFVAVTRQGCIAKDTINITYNLKPKFSLGADSRLCMGSIITLNPQITGVSYLWQDGNTSPTYTITQPGLYSLTATNTCGATTDFITIGNGVCNLYVPNSFTPNGDTKNDVFKASYGDNVTQFHLQVFNRYGQIIFETKDKNKGWDGTFKGSRQPYDGYVWLIQYKTAVNNKMQKLQGSVLLIR